MKNPPDTENLNLKRIIAVISLFWALFQLSLPGLLILDSIKIRSIHLAFALLLLFISVPFRKAKKSGRKRENAPRTISLYQILLAIIGCITALYIMIDWQGIALRSGKPILRDIIMVLVRQQRQIPGWITTKKPGKMPCRSWPEIFL